MSADVREPWSKAGKALLVELAATPLATYAWHIVSHRIPDIEDECVAAVEAAHFVTREPVKDPTDPRPRGRVW